jgi:predicted RNA binding protein YcfA (HicA-like mRNA interferase family)
MRNNPRDWRIEDLKVLANRLGVAHDQNGTSHVVFRHATAGRVAVPVRKPIKPVYVREFLELIDRIRRGQ